MLWCEKRARLLLNRGRAVLRVGGDARPRAELPRAEVLKGNKVTIHLEPVAVRASGSFRVGDAGAINATSGNLLHRADRYGAGGLTRGRRR